MRVVLVNLWNDQPSHEAQIASDPLRRELARRLAVRGHEVHVVQEHPIAGRLADGAVQWTFVAPSVSARAARAVLRGRDDARVKAPASHVIGPVLALRPHVIHSFDLASYPTLALLGAAARVTRSALVAHFHGGAPARTRALRAIERLALARTDALLFTTRERGLDWVRSGALPDDRRIIEVVESSSTFTPGDRAAARARTGLQGAPVLLHLGRLDPVKDPLTTMRGYRNLHSRLPGARLYLAYRDAPLEAEVRREAEGLPVTWLGPRADAEELLRSADLLLQASRREVCGYAVLEALATGTAPVLSDIPSFRKLVDGGRLGRLFRPGDPEALAAAAEDAWAAVPGELSPAAVRAGFDAELSFDRLTDRIEAVYRSVHATRTNREASSEASHSSSSA